jgi:hypothetical protein
MTAQTNNDESQKHDRQPQAASTTPKVYPPVCLLCRRGMPPDEFYNHVILCVKYGTSIPYFKNKEVEKKFEALRLHTKLWTTCFLTCFESQNDAFFRISYPNWNNN